MVLIDPFDLPSVQPHQRSRCLTRAHIGAITEDRRQISDNGVVKKLLVNGKEAKSVTGTFAEWEVVLDVAGAETKVEARAEDAAGNVEKCPHVVTVR